MNKHLRDILERVESWPPDAQEALARAASSIEAQLPTVRRSKPSLREIMRQSPLADVDLERRSVATTVRDVNL